MCGCGVLFYLSKVLCFKMNVFLGKLFIYSIYVILKSPVRRGSISWIDRLPVIQEMTTLKLDIKSRF